MNIMIFDIETVPDVETGRILHVLDGLSDEDVGKAMQQLRIQKTGRDFMAHHLHRIVAISIVFRHGDQVNVWSLGDPDSPEEELIQRFSMDWIDIHLHWSPGMVPGSICR